MLCTYTITAGQREGAVGPRKGTGQDRKRVGSQAEEYRRKQVPEKTIIIIVFSDRCSSDATILGVLIRSRSCLLLTVTVTEVTSPWQWLIITSHFECYEIVQSNYCLLVLHGFCIIQRLNQSSHTVLNQCVEHRFSKHNS